ncbi:hypothetical protein [Thiomicrorhabdus xiamenensis]|uniref:Uncharacterized protein n=1 Tax=Thiomicrorhabdus xiamenensis TaxID=2739063 RepID=A0A7D4TAG7_9GAMM|nr:hypothetical protein [Thiomicrorhabdus xiamenensis]QKI89106.1 hypothetical protein HQN79_05745 [Thiomicrorhabdus xiamenensis]
MSSVSVNGLLQPVNNQVIDGIDNPYIGHFLKISYSQLISQQPVFSKDRVDVEGGGAFRFALPKDDLLQGKSIKIEVFSPDGALLGSQNYSIGSLYTADIAENAEDDSKPFRIQVDPKIVEFCPGGECDQIREIQRNISGKLVDISGENKVAGVQIVIMASDDPAAEMNDKSFQPVLTLQTDQGGHFFGRADSREYEQAYGLIAGLQDTPVHVELEDKKISETLLLVADLSTLQTTASGSEGTPKLPEAKDMIGSGTFSQDIGGKCVDFTIPNRTLEEFSFYHTVRTTEPEIRGLTITSKESRQFITELDSISDELFTVFNRMNNSMSSMDLLPISVDEEEQESASAATQSVDNSTGSISEEISVQPKTLQIASVASATLDKPVYHLKIATGIDNIKLATPKTFDFTAIAKFLAEQARRRAKLQRLHHELAAAYCGKNGAEAASSYCETLKAEDSLNRATILSLLGHVERYAQFDPSNHLFADKVLPKLLLRFVEDVREIMKQSYVEGELISLTQKRAEKMLLSIDHATKEVQDQEELLGYLRDLIHQFSLAAGKDSHNFEPCPTRKTATMGILCLVQQFDDTRETLRNKAVFTLGEILSIRANYDTYIASINAFSGLLEKFHNFYQSGSDLFVSLDDRYFIEHYDAIRAGLQTIKRRIFTAISKIEAIQAEYITNHPGRKQLSAENSVDWDDTPTVYENTTIAHGHILHFKQKWKADGYSLGDLLYSLPLAPCQEKQIAIIDWDREERAQRSEAQTVSESIAADISHDRDISEIINSTFAENIRASSHNETSGTSAGIGGGIMGSVGKFVGGLFGGVSHSGSSSSSSASQDSARNLSGSTLNRLQDSISQSASALRSQRSTVVQTVGQHETVSAQTEVIKNNNHCHAMTVEYFEVLKHYAIEQELVDVQECLFVPLPMSHFDYGKVLRWKNTLRRAVAGHKLQRGFDAIERITSLYADSDMPSGSYADEAIKVFSGHFSMTFELQRPYMSEIEEQTKTVTETIELKHWFPWFDRVFKISYDKEVPLTEAEKDAVFEADYAADIVRKFIEKLDIYAVADDGSEIRLDLDYTQLSNYRRGTQIQVKIASRSMQHITRRQIQYLRLRANTQVHASSKIILRAAYLHYRTAYSGGSIIRNGRINNDVINVIDVKVSGLFDIDVDYVTDAALMYTPLSDAELRDPRKEDREAATELLSFLNEHMEMAHKVIWSSLDSSRLFGLLDGYIAPNSGGKSVASVVENKVIGVVGNNLVLKVVPGERLDPVFKSITNLMAYYKPTTRPDPYRISMPTKGVYAESVMGKCNSCEEIDDSRHWRFEDVPCGTTPTAINPLSTESRRSDIGDLQVKDLPANIITMQNAPNAPDPTGLGAAFELLGKSEAFKDMTGLSGTQANALEALKTTSKSVTDLAGMAVDFQKQNAMKKDIGKTLKAVQEAQKSGQISKEQANQLAYKALSSMVGEPTAKDSKSTATSEAKELTKAAGANKASVKIAKPDGEKIEVDAKTSNDSLQPQIVLSSNLTAEVRAFNPAKNDKSLIIEVGASLQNAPEGATLQWVAEDASALKVDSPNALVTRVKGIKPGKQLLVAKLADAGGNTLVSKKVQLSVPQCVTVDEDAALFDAALSAFQLSSVKSNVVDEMKKVSDQLLSTANVRVFWKFGGYSESVPAHVPNTMVVSTQIKNTDPGNNGVAGVTTGSSSSDLFNETIVLYPGVYQLPNAIDVDTETQGIVLQLESSITTDEDGLIPVAIKVFGRLIGETLSHEIGHALLWDDIKGQGGHNSPSISGDIMNRGLDRNFKQRTGMENTAQQSPVHPDDFIDHGIGKINKFLAVNQAHLDSQWPVPPAFA